jgi:kinesin family protein 18/19
VQSYSATRVYTVAMTYVEIYNENVRDLLSGTDEYLDLREDPVKGQCVAGVSEHNVRSTDDILDLLLEGNKRRMQEPTAANRESSRSHAVLQIHVRGEDLPKPGAAVVAAPVARGKLHRGGYREAQAAPAQSRNVRIGKFSLIDLAGSERAANTKNSGIRLVEGANINRSLLALGNCIEALVAGKGSYVPYRDSKLTRLLKDSLGGNCKTVMISCISPAVRTLRGARTVRSYTSTLTHSPRFRLAGTLVRGNVQYSQVREPREEHPHGDFQGRVLRRRARATKNGREREARVPSASSHSPRALGEW